MFGSIIRQARRARQLTQTQLAEISGVEQANISAIERDRRQPTAATLHQLLTACGYELVARGAGEPIRFPVVDEYIGDVAPPTRVALTATDRNKQVIAVLQASEATVRSQARRR